MGTSKKHPSGARRGSTPKRAGPVAPTPSGARSADTRRSTGAKRQAPSQRADVRPGARQASATRSSAARPTEVSPAPRRRALSHERRAIEIVFDDAGLGEDFRTAFNVPLDDAAISRHVHGFHSYPARMHPLTARRIVLAVSKPRGRLLDPFCGSGTVVVEARLAGRRPKGSDVNPVATALARVKSRGYDDRERQALRAAAEQVAAHADARRIARAGPTKRYGPPDRELFEIHVLLELDGLRSGIDTLRAGPIRDALELVLSAILVKVSRQPGDTAHDRKVRRLAAGYCTRLFRSKAEDLVERLAEFATSLPARSSTPEIVTADARHLDFVESGTADAIVTSPPYPGVYDYVDHHAARLRWLGMDAAPVARAEIGARRQSAKRGIRAALTTWEQDFGACLSECARALCPGGLAAFVIADSVIAGKAARADEYTPRLAKAVGLEWVAAAKQPRPYFHDETRESFRGRPRAEHLLVFRRTDQGPPAKPRARRG